MPALSAARAPVGLVNEHSLLSSKPLNVHLPHVYRVSRKNYLCSKSAFTQLLISRSLAGFPGRIRVTNGLDDTARANPERAPERLSADIEYPSPTYSADAFELGPHSETG